MRHLFIYLLFLVPVLLQAQIRTATVNGLVTLDGETDHSGIRVVFEPQTPSAVQDSTLSLIDGSYSIGLAEGIYQAHYSKSGFEEASYPENVTAIGLVTLDPIALQAGAVTHVSGDINGVWPAGMVFIVDDSLRIPVGDTLRIEAGVNVRFDGFYPLDVLGTLLVEGTEADTVRFSSSLPTSAAGDWQGIKITGAGAAGSQFQYAIVEYAGGDAGSGIRIEDTDDAGENETLNFQHCVVQHCSATNSAISAMRYGGGIYCRYANPVFNELLLQYNYAASYGGGVYFQHSNASINGGTIQNNTSANYGGGMHLASDSNLSVSDTDIYRNTADNAGGISLYNCDPEFLSVSISENHAVSRGALSISHSSPSITNSHIVHNTYDHSGAVYMSSSDPIFESCAIVDNVCENPYYGYGDLYLHSNNSLVLRDVLMKNEGSKTCQIEYSNNNVEFINCTLNSPGSVISTYSGYDHSNSTITLQNTVINSSPASFDLHGNITLNASYCLFAEEGQISGDGTANLPALFLEPLTVNANGDPCDFYNNLVGFDPLFTEPDSADFSLQLGSPCIDAGDPSSPLDPDGSICDIGAFPFNQELIVIPGDLVFGNVSTGDASTLPLLLTNSSDHPIQLYEIISSELAFSVIDFPEGVFLATDDSLEFLVTFTPLEIQGYLGSLTLLSDSNDRVIQLSGLGMGAHLTVDTGSLNFGAIEPGYSANLPIQIYNSGNTPLTITELILAAPFTCPDASLPSSLPAGEYDTLRVVFTPMGNGIFSSYLNLVSNTYPADTLVVQLIGEGGLIPAAVTDLSISMQDTDSHLSWTPVTETVNGNPLILDFYAIFYSEIAFGGDELFYYHGWTTDTTYIHERVAEFTDQMFYQVAASMNQDILDNLQQGTVTFDFWKDMQRGVGSLEE